MKILLLAGEESGVLYARRLAASPLLSGAEIRGYADYGFKTSDLAVMGFGPVLRKLFYFLRVRRTMCRAIDDWRPDVVCTIDYPGMNLRLAAYAKARGIRTVHVVCPQVWAWKKGRIPKIEASLDRLCCFFPFEPELFRPDFATFVGHPLVAEFGAAATHEKGLVACLPGSRVGEIERNLPVMLEAFARLSRTRSTLRLAIPAASERTAALVREVVRTRLPDALEKGTVALTCGDARAWLAKAECAVVASGTATLEAALSHCPTVLVYRVSAAFARFARLVIKGIRFVGLANIIWDKTPGAAAHPEDQPMTELLQEAFTPEAVVSELEKVLGNEVARRAAVARLDRVCARLACAGDPIARIAGTLLEKSDALLEVRGLKVAFPVRTGVFARVSGEVKAVDGVSFEIRRGETLGLVGESGCGKSTTARAILRLVRPTAGEIRFDGRDVLALSGPALMAYRRRVQVVFQDPLASLNPRFTICETVTEAAVAHGLCPKKDRRAFAAKLLSEVGLGEEVLDRYPHEFSGGQRQRVSIARALALDPELLICDEAVSALDLSVRAQVLDLLSDLRARRGLTMLFITHDLGVVRHLATRVLVMEKGRVVESGPCADVLLAPQHPYTRRLVASVPRLP